MKNVCCDKVEQRWSRGDTEAKSAEAKSSRVGTAYM